MKSWLWIILVLVSLSVEIRCQTEPEGKYGDRCSSQSSCDFDAKLACIGEFCRCSREYEIFDHAREQCSTKEGESCNPPKFYFGENNPCVSNALCSENNRICVCASHSYPDGQGRCVRKKFYNDTCTSSRECDDLMYLSCVEGQCSCKLSSYDEYYQICRRRVGDGCLRSQDCVKNANCIESKCVCKKDFSETSAKSCGLSYAQPCGGDDDLSCSDVYYACVNGACRCKNPSYEVYDNATQSCLSLVGGLCHLFLSSANRQPLRLKNCVRNAECVRRELSPLSQCECGKDFVETVSGHCRLPYGAACKVPGEKEELQCIEPLACRNMRCGCQNENDIYEPGEKVCKRIVGSICSKDAECVANAECEISRCRCGSGFLPTFRGFCEQEIEQQPSVQEPVYSFTPSSDAGYTDFNNYHLY